MKNKYNPYTVPAGFFDDFRSNAMAGYRNRKRTMQYAVAAVVVAAALVVIPLLVSTSNSDIQGNEVVSNNLAGMYEYDIFLQVHFTTHQ